MVQLMNVILQYLARSRGDPVGFGIFVDKGSECCKKYMQL